MEEQIKTLLYNSTVGKLSTIIIGIIIIWMLVKFTQRTIVTKVSDNNSKYKSKKLATIIGYLATILLIAFVFSNKLGSLTIALGVAGAGIAFALQEVIASFAGWLAISFGGFYKSGDRVQLGGIKGDVMDIGVLRTTMMEIGQWVDGDLYNGRIVLIANSFVFKEPVFNYSGDFPFLWDEIKIPISYGSNYSKTKEILTNCTNKVVDKLTQESEKQWKNLQNNFLLEDAQMKPMISLILNDNWVEYTIRYVVSYKKRRFTKNELFSEILEEIEKTQGEIKFASATFQLVDAPELKININGKIPKK